MPTSLVNTLWTRVRHTWIMLMEFNKVIYEWLPTFRYICRIALKKLLWRYRPYLFLFFSLRVMLEKWHRSSFKSITNSYSPAIYFPRLDQEIDSCFNNFWCFGPPNFHSVRATPMIQTTFPLSPVYRPPIAFTTTLRKICLPAYYCKIINRIS